MNGLGPNGAGRGEALVTDGGEFDRDREWFAAARSGLDIFLRHCDVLEARGQATVADRPHLRSASGVRGRQIKKVNLLGILEATGIAIAATAFAYYMKVH